MAEDELELEDSNKVASCKIEREIQIEENDSYAPINTSD